MERKEHAAILAVIIVAAAAVGAIILSDESEAAPHASVRVYVDGESAVTGSGSDLKAALEDALHRKGVDAILSGTGVVAVNGNTAPEGKAWTVQQWLPPRGWQVVNFINAAANFANGTAYCVHLSDVTMKDGVMVYSHPGFEPEATAHFYIRFIEDVDANEYITSKLSTEEQREGIWIAGTGSSAAWAFKDACERQGYELNMSDGVKGDIVDPDYIGWLYSFFGLGDVLMSGTTNNGAWKYWSQFYWDPGNSKWIYGETLGHYDPAVISYFALLRQITTSSDGGTTPDSYTDPGVNPAEATVIKPTFTVTFLDGDGEVLDVQKVKSGRSASPPETASKSPQGDVTFTFKGWEDGYANVVKDVTVNPVFIASSNMVPEGVRITNAPDGMKVGSSYFFRAETLPMEIEGAHFSWSSDNAQVIAIDGDGKATALSEGEAKITVEIQGQLESAVVAVSMDLNKESLVIAGGDMEIAAKEGYVYETPLGTVGIPASVFAIISANSSGKALVQISVSDVSRSQLSPSQKQAVGSNLLYDIAVSTNEKDISSFSEAVKIAIPYDGRYGSDVAVFCLSPDGSTERFECVWDRDRGLAAFETNHLSMYFAGEAEPSPSEAREDGGSVWILIVCVAAAAAAASILLHMRRAKAGGSGSS